MTYRPHIVQPPAGVLTDAGRGLFCVSGGNARIGSMTGSWHPMLATEERTPGMWTMVAPDGIVYGRVEIRRAGEHVFYRSWFREVELIHSSSLRDATMLVHSAYIATMSPGPPPGGIYPDLNGIVGA